MLFCANLLFEPVVVRRCLLARLDALHTKFLKQMAMLDSSILTSALPWRTRAAAACTLACRCHVMVHVPTEALALSGVAG